MNLDDGTRWEVVPGVGVDQILEFESFELCKEGRFAAVTDHRNSVVGWWNADNRQMEHILEYTPHGRIRLLAPDGSEVCKEEGTGVDCVATFGLPPFGFAGAYRSDRTGVTYMRNRWYAPKLGQFLTHDPLGYFDAYNLYSYAGMDPINFWDPYGLGAESNGKCGFMSRCDVREGLHDEFDLSPYEAPYPEDAGDRMLAGMQKTLTNDGLDMLCYGGGIGERICGRASDAPFEREEITDVYEKAGENIVRTFEATQGTKALGELVVKNQDEVRALLRRLHADESGAIDLDEARRLLLELLEKRVVTTTSEPFRKHSAKLQEIVNQLTYADRAEQLQIPGGLAGAIRHTRQTGELVGGSNHVKKGTDVLRRLGKLRRQILNSHSMSAEERAMILGPVDAHIADLSEALL